MLTWWRCLPIFRDGIGEVYNCPEMGENYCRWTYTDSGGKSPVYGVLHYMTLTATNALGSASVLHEVDPENQGILQHSTYIGVCFKL